jgi:hypothetical protein
MNMFVLLATLKALDMLPKRSYDSSSFVWLRVFLVSGLRAASLSYYSLVKRGLVDFSYDPLPSSAALLLLSDRLPFSRRSCIEVSR